MTKVFQPIMRLAALAAMVALCVGCMMVKGGESTKGQTTINQAQGTQGVFIHLTHGAEDPHRALMALRMADLMSEDGGAVLLYCDIEAVHLLCQGAPDLQKDPFPPSGQLIARLLEKNVPVLACPGCLKAAGKTPQDLLPGVQAASKDAFWNFCDGRILTLDY